MEADGQMSFLSLQHRTRISRLKFNTGDSEITPESLQAERLFSKMTAFTIH